MHVVHSNKKQSEQTATPDKYPQGYFNDKPCRECGTFYSPKAPSHLYCSDNCADIATTRRYLRKNYKMTLEEYLVMVEQHGGECAICTGPGFTMNRNQRSPLVIDHCHTTGKVRGLLCHNCNRALGLLQDSVENMKRAIHYLEGATTIPRGSSPKQGEAHDTQNG